MSTCQETKLNVRFLRKILVLLTIFLFIFVDTALNYPMINKNSINGSKLLIKIKENKTYGINATWVD